MNRIKSIFISVYIMVSLVITFYALYRLFEWGFSFAWFGVMLSAGIPAGFIGFLMSTQSRARTSANLPFMTTTIVLGIVPLIYGFFRAESGSGLALVCGLIAILGWIIYDFWFSRLDRKPNKVLVVGNHLPLFELEDEQGQKIRSESFVGKPALFLFYRGNWCPLCMAQVKEIAAQYRQLTESGVQIALVSPQPHKNTRKLAEKFNVPFRFLVDVNNQAAKKLDIIHRNGVPLGMEMLGYDLDTVLPTVIITDKKGRVVFVDLTDNYRVRPEPETFLRILNQLD